MNSPSNGGPPQSREPEAHAQDAAGASDGPRYLAVGLTLLIPGAGHFSAGRVAAGAIWMVVALAVYTQSLWWGLAVHALCIAATVRIAMVERPPSAR